MIIDLKAIRQKGISQQQFHFEYAAPESLLSLPGALFACPVIIDVLCELYKNEVYVSGKLSYRISGECSRCLSPAFYSGAVEFDEKFTEASQASAQDENVYEKDKIDLTNLINQLILTDLPFAIHCKDDCRGLCPICGKNLNEGACGCEKI